MPKPKCSNTVHVLILHNEVESDSSVADQDVLAQVTAVETALQELGHRSTRLGCTLDLLTAKRQILEQQPDVVFNLVESLDKTDRLMHVAAALLDSLRIPYTGSTTESLFFSSQKLLAKQWLRSAGLPTPDWVVDNPSGHALQFASPGPRRFIIKSVYEHASFQLDDASIVTAESGADLLDEIRFRARQWGRPYFAEEFIEGREFNLSLLAGEDGPQVLPPAEIDFSNFPAGKPRIVGHDAKWSGDSFEYQNTPRTFDFPQHDQPLLDDLSSLAIETWKLFGVRGYARVDFRVSEQGVPTILEINSNPCLSLDAGYAAALKQAQIDFPTAIARILSASTPYLSTLNSQLSTSP